MFVMNAEQDELIFVDEAIAVSKGCGKGVGKMGADSGIVGMPVLLAVDVAVCDAATEAEAVDEGKSTDEPASPVAVSVAILATALPVFCLRECGSWTCAAFQSNAGSAESPVKKSIAAGWQMYRVESVMKASASGTKSTDIAVLRPILRFLACTTLASANVSDRVRCFGGCASTNGSRLFAGEGIGLGLRLERDEDEDGRGDCGATYEVALCIGNGDGGGVNMASDDGHRYETSVRE